MSFCIYIKKNFFKKITLLFLVIILSFLLTFKAHAEYERYGIGETATIGEFVYDDNFVATTTPCTINIINPNGIEVVEEDSMTALSNGWHYYDFSIVNGYLEGVWPTSMSCGVPGIDLVKLDKTFMVGAYNVSTSSISNSVWSSAGRTLTSVGSLVSDIWANGTRTLTGASLDNGSLATLTDINNASSSLYVTIPASVWSQPTRSLTTFGSLVSDVWSNGTRTLTTAALGAADIWSYASRNLTSATLDTGSLALQSDISNASTSINNQILQGTSEVNSNTNSVISYASSSIANTVATNISLASTSIGGVINTGVANVNSNTNSQIASAITTINSNTNATVLTASTSLASTIPTSVWSSTNRSLTTFGTLVSDIWSNGTRTLTSVGGNDLTAEDVWTYASRNLTSATLDTGSLALQSDITTASTSLGSVINLQTSNVNSNTNSVVLNASSSVGSLIAQGTSLVNSNTNNQISNASSSIGNIVTNHAANTNSTILTASTSIGSVINTGVATVNTNTDARVLIASTSLASTIPQGVWSSTSRTLTSFGTLVSDIWANGTRTLTGGVSTLTASDVWSYATRNLSSAALDIGTLSTLSDINTASSSLASSIQAISNPWIVTVSNFDGVIAGDDYRATVYTSYNGNLTDSANIPSVTIYDASRNVVVSSVAMTKTGTGTYAYSYTTAGNAQAGTWETIFNATVASGKSLSANDYWSVETNPAQVIINDITDTEVPEISANVTITNEGLTGYEYQYEWCVVSQSNNSCGGGDDVFYGLAAKFINPGEDFNTNITATVPNAGDYYFKVLAYFGTDSSTALRSFTATGTTVEEEESPSSGGGGGGGSSAPEKEKVLVRSDLDGDHKIDSKDFSILLYFWKAKPPFANPYVDMNKDGRIDSIDFSILLFQWTK